jgi:uncharacterized membrane protein
MKNIKQLITRLAAFFGAAAMVAQTKIAHAQLRNPVTGEFGDPASLEDAKSGALFTRYFVLVWNAAITVGALVVIIMFIWGAVQWITSGDDAGKVQAAQRRLLNAALGIVLLVASFTIIAFINQLFFGGEFDILSPVLPFASNAEPQP